MVAFPELEPSLVEVAIGEVDEPPASPQEPRYAKEQPSTSQNTNSSSSKDDVKHRSPAAAAAAAASSASSRVQRSHSDRYSYRAAIYNSTDQAECDI